MPRNLTTMTAIASLLISGAIYAGATEAEAASNFVKPKVNIQPPRPRVVRPPVRVRVPTDRLAPSNTQQVESNDGPSTEQAAPVRAPVAPRQVPAVAATEPLPQIEPARLPRPRPEYTAELPESVDDIAIIADIEPLQAPVHETRSYDRGRFYFVDYGHRSSDGQTGPTLQDGPEPDTSALGTGAPGRSIDNGSSYNEFEAPGSVPMGNSPIDEYEDRLHDALVAHLSLMDVADIGLARGENEFDFGGKPPEDETVQEPGAVPDTFRQGLDDILGSAGFRMPGYRPQNAGHGETSSRAEGYFGVTPGKLAAAIGGVAGTEDAERSDFVSEETFVRTDKVVGDDGTVSVTKTEEVPISGPNQGTIGTTVTYDANGDVVSTGSTAMLQNFTVDQVFGIVVYGRSTRNYTDGSPSRELIFRGTNELVNPDYAGGGRTPFPWLDGDTETFYEMLERIRNETALVIDEASGPEDAPAIDLGLTQDDLLSNYDPNYVAPTGPSQGSYFVPSFGPGGFPEDPNNPGGGQ